VYHANFADDRDISDPTVLAEVLMAVGQEPEAVLAAAQSAETKAQLRAQADEAVRRGLCGAPSFTVGDEVFWGNDRLEAALAFQRDRTGDAASIESLLRFWFGDPDAGAEERAACQTRWFSSDPGFDAECRDRFAILVGRALRSELDHWQETPAGRLALILLLDQLPRNVFRGTAAAFIGDPKAAAIAATGIDIGADRQLDPIRRAFFYLPLEHAEDAALQTRSVALCEQLAAEALPAQRSLFEEWAQFARQHRDLIARFGRFPHRNVCLGRTSTAEERAYLGEGAPRFGQ
jgi:uncharacterized protein (DUF924 family)